MGQLWPTVVDVPRAPRYTPTSGDLLAKVVEALGQAAAEATCAVPRAPVVSEEEEGAQAAAPKGRTLLLGPTFGQVDGMALR